MNKMVEIRSYNLKRGRRDYLIRAYDSLEHRQASQDAFYGSAEWKQGPREKILALIDSDTSIVIEMDSGAVDSFRRRTK
jgi:hypothetical protein